MIRIWLDDSREKPSHYTHHAKSAGEAIRLLKMGDVERISLDFDLGIGVVDGSEVARFIRDEAVAGRMNKIGLAIHTDSVDGRKTLCNLLQEAYRAWERNER